MTDYLHVGTGFSPSGFGGLKPALHWSAGQKGSGGGALAVVGVSGRQISKQTLQLLGSAPMIAGDLQRDRAIQSRLIEPRRDAQRRVEVLNRLTRVSLLDRDNS